MSILSQVLDESNSILALEGKGLPSNYHKVDVPRRVGFDRIIVGVEILRIDWTILETIKKEEDAIVFAKEGSRTLRLTECRTEGASLSICSGTDRTHWYSAINIMLGSNSLRIRKNNLPNCRDIAILEIVIPPIRGHEILGNISNMTCEEEQEHVRSIMKRIKKYGIYLNENLAILKEAEINVNIRITAANHDYNDAIEILRPYRLCLPGFKDSDYSEVSKLGKNRIQSTYSNGNQWVEPIEIRKREKTSFNSISKSRIIKVYNKAIETIDKSAGQLSFVSPLTRIEFVLTDPNEIPSHFNRKTNLFDMQQCDVEQAFHTMAKSYIADSLKKFYDKVTVAFETYFERIDIKQYAWRKNTVMELDSTVKKMDGFVILPYHELCRLVGLINGNSVTHNKARIAKSLREEFFVRQAVCIRVTDDDEHEELVKWLYSITGEEPQNIIYEIVN